MTASVPPPALGGPNSGAWASYACCEWDTNNNSAHNTRVAGNPVWCRDEDPLSTTDVLHRGAERGASRAELVAKCTNCTTLQHS